jgi:hypothetical protein
MGYTLLLDDDLELDFLWSKTQDIKGYNYTIYIGGDEDCPIARIVIKGSGDVVIPQGIKVALIENFIPSNTLAIPKSLKALQIKSITVRKYEIYIPDSLRELALTSSAGLESSFDVSKLTNLKSFKYSQAPAVKNIGKLPESLEYLTLCNVGLKEIPKNLPVSLKELSIKRFENVISFPDLSGLTKLTFVGIEYTAVGKFSKNPPPSRTHLQFLEIPLGSANCPENYKKRPNELYTFITIPIYKVVNGKVVFVKPLK